MTAAALSNELRGILTRAGIDDPAGDSSLIIENVLGCTRAQLVARRFDEVSDEQAAEAAAMARRRAKGEPIQYVLSVWPFMGRDYAVGEGVLIPRDDTEVVVRAALDMARDIPSPTVTDLCSGSGIIAITLASQLTGADVFAVEKSAEAYGYLLKNIGLNNADIKPIHADLCVCLDQYALGAMERYQYFGVPTYMVRTLGREYIVPDCMMTLATPGLPDGEPTLLDYAIAEGKKYFFVEKTLPGIADTILLRYTGEQLDWMEHNEGQVWAWMIENRMLYSTDQSAWRNLVGDAPHTNAFGSGSAPRTAGFIGWKIVRQYAKRSKCTMEELFAERDSRKILTVSQWRP